MKILCLATFSSAFAVHNYRELLILKSLQLRGAEVDYYQCDCNGLVCSALPYPSPQDKLPKVCRKCSRDGKRHAKEIGIKVKSMSQFFTREICDKAKRWATSLKPKDFLQAKYDDYDLGQWMFYSIITMFRLVKYQPGNSNIDKFYHLFLEDGLRRALALEQLLDAEKYDRILLFSGRLGANKITLEIGKLRNIPVFVHEAGLPSIEDATVNINDLSVTFSSIYRVWETWKNIPLTKSEIDDVARDQFQRELGNESVIGWGSFTIKTNESPLQIKKRLGIDPDKTIWALFPSSTDELASDPVFKDSQGIVWQYQWIDDVLEMASKFPHIHIVIRVHPNMGRSPWSNIESHDDLAWFRGLKERGLEHLTVIDAEDNFSTYDLMDIATVGLAFASTCSMEMALRGKHGCRASSSFGYCVEGAVDAAPDRKALEKCFTKYSRLKPHEKDAEIQKTAFRFRYCMHRHSVFSFPLLKMTTPVSAAPAYSSIEDLSPGRNTGMDIICEAILAGVRPENLPPDDRSTLDDSTESEMFQQVLDIHALGRRVCIDRGEYLVPPNNVIAFLVNQSESLSYCLTGWRNGSDWYRRISGTKATIAFSCRESVPSVIRVRWIIARGQKTELWLNNHLLGTFFGTGWMQEVESTVPLDSLEELNFLSVSLTGSGNGEVLNKKDSTLAAIQAIWFKNSGNESNLLSFKDLCGGIFASLIMYGHLFTRWYRKRF